MDNTPETVGQADVHQTEEPALPNGCEAIDLVDVNSRLHMAELGLDAIRSDLDCFVGKINTLGDVVFLVGFGIFLGAVLSRDSKR